MGERSRRRETIPLAIALILSSASALIYEIAWLREFTILQGASVLSFSTIVSGFMGGLAIGSLLAGIVGRSMDRRRKLEILILCELLVALLGSGIALSWRELWILNTKVMELGGALSEALSFSLGLAVLIPPTTAMGLVAPLISSLIHEKDEMETASTVYALDTSGAVLGTVLSGFALLPTLGLVRTCLIAASLNVLAATILSAVRILEGRYL